MGTEVKIIIDKLDEETLKKATAYVKRLEAVTFGEFTTTVLSPNYGANYPTMKLNQSSLEKVFPQLNIKSFYVDPYYVSKNKNNVDRYIESNLKKYKVVETTDDQGNTLLKQGDDILAFLKYTRNRLDFVDFAKPGQKKPFKRIAVNSDRNVQTIRLFSKNSHLPREEYYVNDDLHPFLTVFFNEKGLRETYQLGEDNAPSVESELDLYALWFEQQINKSDYIINMNRNFNVLFEEYDDLEHVFLV